MQKCWNCGKEGAEHRNIGERDEVFNSLNHYDDQSQRCYCRECFADVVGQYKKDLQEYLRLKKKLIFERAGRIMERQSLDIYDYQEAIQAVQEFAAEKPDKFDSAHEMIAAIVLIYNEIRCELQYKVGRYQCDFCIPSMKVILEIDGDRHKYNKQHDSIRDQEIMKELGSGWNILRIKTDYLEQKADVLVEAIETVIAERNEKKRKAKAFRTQYN